MNRLIARQLKRNLGIQSDQEFVELLRQMSKQFPNSNPQIHQIIEGLPQLIDAISHSYDQFDRDLQLRTRSLELSSTELTQANESLRQENNIRQKAVEELWRTALEIQGKNAETHNFDSQTSLEQLAVEIGSLVRQKSQAQSQFRTLADNIPGVVFRSSSQAPWEMYYISREIERITGYPPQDFIGCEPRRQYQSLVHPDDLQIVLAGTDDCKFYEIEYRIIDRMGKIHWVFERGTVIVTQEDNLTWIDGIIFDISEQKHSAQQVQLLYSALEESPSLVLITEIDGCIVYANPKIQKFMGYEANEVLGRTPRLFASGLEPKELYQQLWNSVLSGNEWHSDIRNCRKDGELIWLSASISPVRNPRGIITHFIAIYEDIHLRKASEEELRRAKETADQANQLKSDFLANMSHEIRTPMNAVLGMSYLALQDQPTPKIHDYLNKIHNSAELLLEIINDLLDFSKIEANQLSLELHSFDLNELLTKLDHLHRHRAEEKGLQLILQRPKNTPIYLRGDAGRLHQILSNLIGNAIKFTIQGTVELIIDWIPAREQNAKMIFHVKDTGIGLSQEQIAKLFRPFVQADASTTRKFGGTGLGLSICKRLVEMMNGKIWIESELGLGSEFHFEIALSELNTEEIGEFCKQKNQGSLSIPNLQGHTVLLVDDNHLNQQVAKGILKKTKAIVHIANHGQEAIELLEQNPILYSLILMDMQMPVMDGSTATQIIRQNPIWNKLPIIAFTAHAFAEEREKCREIGMDDFVTKPLRADQFYSTISKWIDQEHHQSISLANWNKSEFDLLQKLIAQYDAEAIDESSRLGEKFPQLLAMPLWQKIRFDLQDFDFDCASTQLQQFREGLL